MKTIEELAEQVIVDYNTQKRPGWILRDYLAHALRAYGETCAAGMKERDAKIADEQARNAVLATQANGEWARCARAIAALIRAETPSPTPE